MKIIFYLQERDHFQSLREGEPADSNTAKQRFMERVAEREANMKRELAEQKNSSYRPSPTPGGPPPPERKSSYDVYKAQGNLSSAAAGLYDGQNTSRTNSLQQQAPPPLPKSLPPYEDPLSNTPKKSVSFHSDLATEIHYQRRFTESLSSDTGSFPPNSPSTPQSPFPPSQQQAQPQAQPQTQPHQQPTGGQRTPDNPAGAALFVTGDTPGVVGAQEVYRDPRERMLAAKQQQNGSGAAGGTAGGFGGLTPTSTDRLSFRDKMKLFAAEIGESTPEDRSKASRAQQRIEAQLKSP